MFQRRWYEFDEYLSPDNVRYRFQNHERFLLSESGYGMPEIEYISQKGPFQHGETIYDYRLKPRIIQLVIRENQCSREDYWAARANILNIIRPNRQTFGNFGLGKLVKYLPDHSKRAIDVLIQEGPSFEKSRDGWDEYSLQNTLRFIAPDPTFYDPDAKTSVYSLSPDTSAHLVFPFTFDGTDMVFRTSLLSASQAITYSGTWLSLPSFTIDGPAINPLITNYATGETIRLTRDIEDGETITITLEYGNKTVTSDVYGNIIGAVDTSSNLATFHIAPAPEASGGVNTIVFSVSSAGTNTAFSISYYVRYIGI